jgi:hypothetical protein
VQIICPECGKAFDGDQCWVCVARMEDIKETFSLSLPVACAGVIGTLLAVVTYPPLGSYSLEVYILLAVFIIPAGIALILEYFQHMSRYAVLLRSTIVLATAIPLVATAYYSLNGVLDGNPPVEVRALVSHKSIENDGESTYYDFVCTLSWNRKRIEQNLGVNSETFSAAQPGDAVRVVIHPGAFSQPWYSDVRRWGSRVRN